MSCVVIEARQPDGPAVRPKAVRVDPETPQLTAIWAGDRTGQNPKDSASVEFPDTTGIDMTDGRANEGQIYFWDGGDRPTAIED